MYPEANDEMHVNNVTTTLTPSTTGPRHIAEKQYTSLVCPIKSWCDWDKVHSNCSCFNERMSSKSALCKCKSKRINKKIKTHTSTYTMSYRAFSGSTAQLLQSSTSRKLGTATARGRSADKDPLSIFLQVWPHKLSMERLGHIAESNSHLETSRNYFYFIAKY